MPRTEIVLFREDDGTAPVLEWLFGLPAKARAKCTTYIDLLEEHGYDLRRPQADCLRDDIYELRPTFAGQQYRILYFFCARQAVVLSHGIRKEKTVPPGDIERAVERRARFLRNPERHTFHKEKE